MEIDRAERVFVIKAETVLDRAILNALTSLPVSYINTDSIIIPNDYYKKVVCFIARVEDCFNGALCELQKEPSNEI